MDIEKVTILITPNLVSEKSSIQQAILMSSTVDLIEEPIGEVIDQIREALIWLGEPARKITEREV